MDRLRRWVASKRVRIRIQRSTELSDRPHTHGEGKELSYSSEYTVRIRRMATPAVCRKTARVIAAMLRKLKFRAGRRRWVGRAVWKAESNVSQDGRVVERKMQQAVRLP